MSHQLLNDSFCSMKNTDDFTTPRGGIIQLAG